MEVGHAISRLLEQRGDFGDEISDLFRCLFGLQSWNSRLLWSGVGPAWLQAVLHGATPLWVTALSWIDIYRTVASDGLHGTDGMK
jgi:hypothetical protein